MYTLEIDGTALVVTNADEEDARELLGDEDFKNDLKSLTSDGRPLWDGTSPMTIRAATEVEKEIFDDSMEEEEDDEEMDDGEPIDIVFLVEVDENDASA